MNATAARHERGKQDRRARILDAAEALIRETGSTGFTVAALAERAALSGPTPYNLFGSKAAILYALLNRSLDPLLLREQRARPQRDPFARVLAAAELGAELFIDDPAFYRPLYQFLLGVGDPVHRPAFLERSLAFWQRALAPLVEAGRAPPGLARQMVLSFVGALELWVHDELDHAQFRAQIVYGAGLLLLGFADEPQRGALQRRLRGLARRLPLGFEMPARI